MGAWSHPGEVAHVHPCPPLHSCHPGSSNDRDVADFAGSTWCAGLDVRVQSRDRRSHLVLLIRGGRAGWPMAPLISTAYKIIKKSNWDIPSNLNHYYQSENFHF